MRYANALLSQQGTSLERLIVSRRLDRCRRALEDPAQGHRAIGEIAYDWGFGNQSHFNRRFKAEFGCSPSDYRRGVPSLTRAGEAARHQMQVIHGPIADAAAGPLTLNAT